MLFKPVEQFALKSGLNCDKKAGVVYGGYQGYYMAIEQDPTVMAKHTVIFAVKEGAYPLSKQVIAFLNECTGKYKFLRKVSYDNHRVSAEFHGSGLQWGKLYVPMMEEFLQELTAFFRGNQMVNCCEHCGSTEGVSAYTIGGKYHALCQQCHSKVSQSISSTAQAMKSKPGNLLPGLVGALLGSLLGVVAWVLVYQLGYISAIVGLVMVVCAFKGFSLFGGKLNLLGIVCCVAICAFMLYFAEQASLALAIQKELGMPFVNAFKSIPLFMENSEIRSAVISDLIYGYLFMAAGSFSVIWNTYKHNNVTPGSQQLGAITAPAAGVPQEQTTQL